MRRILLALLTALGLTSPLLADAPPKEFSDANAAYAAGKFAEARDGYEALVKAGSWNANLFYNLGNAWFHRGDMGQAVLNYERALALDPTHAEALKNLHFTQERARALQLPLDWTARVLEYLQPPAAAWIAAAAFWFGLFLIVSAFFARPRVARLIVAVLLLLAAGAAGYFTYQVETGDHGRDFAIIIGQSVPARLATADTASNILTLPAGSEVRILSTRGDWSYAQLPNDLRGWIPTDTVERVRL